MPRLPRLPRRPRTASGRLLAAAVAVYVLAEVAGLLGLRQWVSNTAMPRQYQGILEVVGDEIRVVSNARVPGGMVDLEEHAGLMTVQPGSHSASRDRVSLRYHITIAGTPELFTRLAATSPGQLAEDFQRACGWWPETLTLPGLETFDPTLVARRAPFPLEASASIPDRADGRLRPNVVITHTARLAEMPLRVAAILLAGAGILLRVRRAKLERRTPPVPLEPGEPSLPITSSSASRPTDDATTRARDAA